ncbi:MAG TPA: PAS domain S-box protein [bacterium]|nr:PAS domain S-box protein [bacterium]
MHLSLRLNILFAVLILIPLFFVESIIFRHASRELEKAEMTKLEQVADLKMKVVEDFFDERLGDLKAITTNRRIIACVEALLAFADRNGAEAASVKQEIREYCVSMLEAYGYNDILLAAPDGTVLMSTQSADPSGASLSYDCIAKRKKYCFCDVYRSGSSPARFAIDGVGAMTGPSGEVIAYVVTKIDLTDIFAEIQQFEGLGDTGETLLGKRSGEEVTFVNPLRHDGDAALVRKVAMGDPTGLPIQAATLGRDGSGFSTDYRGVRVLAAWRHVAIVNWGLVAKIDEAEALREIGKFRRIVWILNVVVLAIGVVIASAISRSISAPLERLHHGTEIVALGNLDYKVGMPTRDEIGQLSRAFDDMTGKLKQTLTSNDKLEEEIAERRRAEENLHETSDFLEKLFGYANAPIIVWDPSQRITRFNRAFERLTGHAAADVVGKRLDILFPADTREGSLEKIGRTAEGEFWETIEVPILRKDGAVRTVLWNSANIYGQDGTTLQATIAQGQDITMHKQALDALSRAADEWNRTFDAMSDLIFIQDNGHTILRCNSAFAAAMGMPRDAVVGKKCYELVHKLSSHWHDCPFEKTKADGRPHTQAVDDPCVGVPLLVTTSPLYDEEGRMTGSVHVAKDMSEIRRAEKQLRNAEERLAQSEKLASIGQLAAGVAHEINNPLSFVMSNLSMLQKYLERYRQFVGRAEALLPREKIEPLMAELDIDYMSRDLPKLISQTLEGGDRINTIVQGLRSFARPEMGGEQQVSLNEIIDASLSILMNELKYKAEVVRDLGQVPPVKCHPNQISQVFMNILLNAAQAIEKFGTITIRTYGKDGMAVAEIGDTGCGIPPEHIKKIFDPFFSTKPVGSGTGLGLSIAHGIVERHGGSIEVASEPGKGTTFVVRLPIQKD